MVKKTPYIPALFKEKLKLRELTPAQHDEINRTLSVDDQAAVQEELARADDEFLRRYPAAEVARKIADRLVAPSQGNKERAPFLPFPTARPAFIALAAALAAVITVWLTRPGGEEFGIRTKGLNPYMELYLKRDGEPGKLEDGTKVKAGATIQVRYVAAEARYGVILSVDGNGVITRHLPLAGDKAAPLSQEGKATLRHAYELDDAPRFERFFFVTSAVRFKINTVRQAIESLTENPQKDAMKDPLKLPRSWQQSSITLRKVP